MEPKNYNSQLLAAQRDLYFARQVFESPCASVTPFERRMASERMLRAQQRIDALTQDNDK